MNKTNIKINNALGEFNREKVQKNIEGQLNEIMSDVDHFKKSKNFVKFIEKIYEVANNKKIWDEIIENIIIKIEKLDEDELKLIWWRANNFIKYNAKNYIDKIMTENSTIYVYQEHSEWFINNKNIDIIKEYKKLFPNNTISAIYIDNIKRSSIENISSDDIKYSKKIKIIIKNNISSVN